MVDVELSDMGNMEAVRKRGGGGAAVGRGLELEEQPSSTTDDHHDMHALLGDSSVGSFSKEPKQQSAAASASSNPTVCIAVTLILGGLFLVMFAGKGGEGALNEKKNKQRGSSFSRIFDFGWILARNAVIFMWEDQKDTRDGARQDPKHETTSLLL